MARRVVPRVRFATVTVMGRRQNRCRPSPYRRPSANGHVLDVGHERGGRRRRGREIPVPAANRRGGGPHWRPRGREGAYRTSPLRRSPPRSSAAVWTSTWLRGRLPGQCAIYISYMAPRAHYVRLPRRLSGSSGSGGSGIPLSSLFSTRGRSPNPTLSAKSRSFRINHLAWRGGCSRAMRLKWPGSSA